MENKALHIFNRPVLEIIKSRRSVRTYSGEPLTEELLQQLRNYVSNIQGPFKPKVRLELIENSSIEQVNGGKIGTYGVIKGSKDYVAGVVEEGEKSLEQLGYVLESFILYATSLGLGTCWLGGTFKRNQFSSLVGLKEQESIPIVTPIGYPGTKRSIVESLMRFGAGSDQRKQWEELFFSNSFLQPLVNNETEYCQALEGVRLAPSASNKQPWRVIRLNGIYHFYIKRNKGYAKSLGFDIQSIDMGIAMCHFELVLKELGISGNWVTTNPLLVDEGLGLDYVVSWVANKQ